MVPQNTLYKFYEDVLKSAGLVADQDGLLSFVYEGVKYPVLVEDKRLALPTQQLLRAGDWSELRAFHPLSENQLRAGESPVLRKLKAILMLRLSAIISDLMLQFVNVGADPSLHKAIPPKAQALLSAIPEVDLKSVEAMQQIIEECSSNARDNLISLYIKRGGMYKGNKYHRVAVVAFPIMEALEDESREVFGVKLRKKDQAAFSKLFQYILPDAQDLEAYSAPSNSMVAPSFDALIKAYGKVAMRLNEVVALHRKQLENPDDLLVNTDWLAASQDLSVFRDLIPPLEGNDGAIVDDAHPEPTKVPVARGIPDVVATGGVTRGPIAPPAVPSVPAEQREPVEAGKKSPFNTDFHRQETVHAATPVPASAGVARTAGGLDFNSVMAARARAAGQPPATMGGYPAPGAPAPVAYPAWGAPPAQVTRPAWGTPPAPAPGVGTTYYRGMPVNPAYGHAPYGYPGGGQPMVNVPDWAREPVAAPPAGQGNWRGGGLV